MTTNNGDGDDVCTRVEALVCEYEQAREPDATELARQFAVRDCVVVVIFPTLGFFFFFPPAITTNNDRE